MFNFIIQIITSVFIGWSFVFLAKKYQKNQAFYFCIGFFVCLIFRIVYLLIYGVFTNFKVHQNLDNHRNLSIVLSIIVSFIVFILIKKRLQKNNAAIPKINDIGKE